MTSRAETLTAALRSALGDKLTSATTALGDVAALPVKSFIKHYRDEFQHHIDHKQCLVPTYV